MEKRLTDVIAEAIHAEETGSSMDPPAARDPARHAALIAVQAGVVDFRNFLDRMDTDDVGGEIGGALAMLRERV